jgi:hypothetical protein
MNRGPTYSHLMKPVLLKLHHLFLAAGQGVSIVPLFLAMLLLFPGIPLIGAAVSLWIGQEMARFVGGGFWTIIVTAFICFMFLAHYVWHPYVSDKVMKAFGMLSSWH